jgi:hypothetical protein
LTAACPSLLSVRTSTGCGKRRGRTSRDATRVCVGRLIFAVQGQGVHAALARLALSDGMAVGHSRTVARRRVVQQAKSVARVLPLAFLQFRRASARRYAAGGLAQTRRRDRVHVHWRGSRGRTENHRQRRAKQSFIGAALSLYRRRAQLNNFLHASGVVIRLAVSVLRGSSFGKTTLLTHVVHQGTVGRWPMTVTSYRADRRSRSTSSPSLL